MINYVRLLKHPSSTYAGASKSEYKCSIIIGFMFHADIGRRRSFVNQILKFLVNCLFTGSLKNSCNINLWPLSSANKLNGQKLKL